MENLGLNFRDARVCVKQAIEKALTAHSLDFDNKTSASPTITSYFRDAYQNKKRRDVLLYLDIPIICCTVAFSLCLLSHSSNITNPVAAVTSVFSALSNGLHGLASGNLSLESVRYMDDIGLILSIFVLVAVARLNNLLIITMLNTKRTEVMDEIRRILKDYEDWLEYFQPHNGQPPARMITNNSVALGHPHVSLVSCWRNGLWQRIPVLLLAEGDIIALMGGDLTPGNVHEIIFNSKDKANTTMGSSSSSVSEVQPGWKLGAKLKIGHKIRLRRSNDGKPSEKSGYAQHSFVKHRSLPPDSIELLILSGDIRCFQMAETPMYGFIKTLLASNEKSNHIDSSFFQNAEKEVKGSVIGQSYIRKLFALVLRRAHNIFLPTLLVLFAIFVSLRYFLMNQWQINDLASNLIVPLGVICMCFIPMSLPLCYLISESLTLADILATIEASLEEPLKNIEGIGTASPGLNKPVSARNIQETLNRSERSTSDRRSSFGMSREGYSDRSSSDEDEFLDEDIDEREEEIAEEASKLVSWKRYLQYVVHVFSSRLGSTSHLQWIHSNDPSTQDHHGSSKLNLFRRIQRFLLQRLCGHVPPFLPLPFIQTKLLETLGGTTMICFVDDDIICEGYSVTEELYLLVTGEKDITSGRKGTVLDLHANPEAKGSRFENPLWWKFLPILKPIALNSMLTYSSAVSTDILLREIPSNLKSNRSRNNSVTKRDSASEQLVPLVTTRNKAKVDGLRQRREPTEMEKELVRHVRRTIPLESLKELAEEIGFIPEDVSAFSKLFELNVLAPRLGDAQLLEDYHAWGQEETRRRGTLLAQVRSVIVKDSRGGLQMMSQGDPSLILKYCREFWDGASIAPLNTTDREDILNLYDRYRKEDFDVVCFAYSPIPVSLQPLILAAVTNNADFLTASVMEQNMHPFHLESYDDGDVKCLLFVDPSTASDLMEANTNRSSSTARRNQTSKPSKRLNRATIAATSDVLNTLNPNAHANLARRSRDDPSAEAYDKQASEQMVDEYVDIEQETGRQKESSLNIATSVSGPPSLQDVSALLNAVSILESPLASTISASTVNSTPPVTPLTTVGAQKLTRELSYDMRSRSESNLRKVLHDGLADAVMFTNSESLNCETLIREMEQLDNNEEIAVLQDDGMMSPLESVISSSRYDPPNIFSSSSRPIIVEIKPDDLDENFHDAEILDESLMEVEEAEEDRPRRHSFDDDMVADLMSTSNRTKSISHDHDDLAPIPAIKSTSFTDVRTSLSPISGSPRDSGRLSTSPKDADRALPMNILSTDHHDALVTHISPPTSTASRLRTKSLDSFPKDELYSENIDALEDDSKLSSQAQEDASSPMFTTSSLSNKARGSESKAYEMKQHTQAFNRNLIQFSSSRGGRTQRSFSNAVQPDSFKKNITRQPSSSEESVSEQDRGLDQKNLQEIFGNALIPKKRSLGAQLWPLMRQQVFLGLAASSVPVKPEVPNLLENLNAAGVRFIYFSPRNMRRSKPVAEKIGIQFDWNCAISLRSLGEHDEHDPHRYISSYADWDVQAKMPHGVEAIKRHLQEVDNVPLLVNLYTDATPSSTCEMIEVFKSYGEVVLTIGSSFRANNQPIFRNSDVGVAIAMLPGSSSHIPSTVDAVLSKIPLYSEISLSQSDMILTFRLVGLGSIPLLQLPSTLSKETFRKSSRYHRPSITGNLSSTNEPEELRLGAITETIRKGRLYILNILQSLGFLSVCTLALAIWPIAAQGIPMPIAPSISPAMALLFLLWYYPVLVISIMLSDTSESVMKSTPRKSVLQLRPRDETRFLSYLFIRAIFVVISVFLQGFVAASSTFKASSINEETRSQQNIYGYWLVQDLMATQLMLQVICQAASLMERGQRRLPDFVEHSQFFIATAVIFLTHLWIMAIRVMMRSASDHNYKNLNWLVWLVMILMPILGLAVGFLVNGLDDKWYRRYLQFLRLEFDTKLGMHSPR
jgi:hypothetical protein